MLYLISHEEFFENEVRIVSEILEQFSITFHLRKPGASVEQYQQFLKQIPQNQHNKIMLHGAYQLSDKYDLKGIHFSTINRKIAMAFPNIYKSTSCHSFPEVNILEGTYDSMFLSPVYNSISKKDYQAAFDKKELTDFLKKPHKSKIIALGGIQQSNLLKTLNMGFSGAAIKGIVWGDAPEKNNDILKNFEKVYNCLYQDHIV